MKFEDLDQNKKYVNNRYSIIKKNGKIILSINFSNLKGLDQEKFFDSLEKWLSKTECKPNSVLELIDGSNNKLNKKMFDFLKKMVVSYSKRFSKKTAIYGISNSQILFVNIMNKLTNINVKVFKTKEEAVEWLTK